MLVLVCEGHLNTLYPGRKAFFGGLAPIEGAFALKSVSNGVTNPKKQKKNPNFFLETTRSSNVVQGA